METALARRSASTAVSLERTHSSASSDSSTPRLGSAGKQDHRAGVSDAGDGAGGNTECRGGGGGLTTSGGGESMCVPFGTRPAVPTKKNFTSQKLQVLQKNFTTHLIPDKSRETDRQEGEEHSREKDGQEEHSAPGHTSAVRVDAGQKTTHSLCCARREPRHSLSPGNPVCTSRARVNRAMLHPPQQACDAASLRQEAQQPRPGCCSSPQRPRGECDCLALSPNGSAPPLVWQQSQAAAQAALAQRRRQASTRLPVAYRRIGPRLRLQASAPAAARALPLRCPSYVQWGYTVARRQDPQNRRKPPKIEVDRPKLSPPPPQTLNLHKHHCAGAPGPK